MFSLTVTVKGLVEKIERRDNTIKKLRNRIGDISQEKVDLYLQFAVLLGNEIGKLHKLIPEELDIRIMLDGKIVISTGNDKSFRLEFNSFTKQLEYLLCMSRLIGLEDGAAVAYGRKSQVQVYHEVKQDYPDNQNQCKSCGKLLPPLDKDDDPALANICESCYQNGEY